MQPSLARLAAAILIGATFSLPAHSAWAQVRAELPAAVVEAGSIGANERGQIEAYLQNLAGALQGQDPEAVARARKDLVIPLTNPRASVAFRQAYNAVAAGAMASLLGSEDAAARIAGLRLAGHLATSEGAAAVRAGLTDRDAGVALFAAVQARRVFEITANAGPALPESQLLQLVEALGTSLKADAPEAQAGAVFRALGAGAAIRSRDLSATRSRSLETLAKVASQRVRAVGPDRYTDEENTVLTAATLATRSLTEAGVSVNEAAVKAAAELGGDMLSMTLRRQTRQLITDAGADLRLLNAGESLIYFARRRHAENSGGNANAVPQTTLADLLSNKDRGFRNELVRLIGPGSDFLRQFGLPDARFVE